MLFDVSKSSDAPVWLTLEEAATFFDQMNEVVTLPAIIDPATPLTLKDVGLTPPGKGWLVVGSLLIAAGVMAIVVVLTK